MKTKISRRELVRSIPGITLGSGFLTFPFRGQSAYSHTPLTGRKINVKVSPPGPESLAVLEDYKRYIGISGYSGLYSVGLKGGNGVYIQDLDDNIYLDSFTAASCAILGYSHDEIAQAYYDVAINIQQTESGYSPIRRVSDY